MSSSLRHRTINLLQSILLVGGMGVLAWVIVSAVADPQTALAIVLGSLIGMLFLPGLARKHLLAAYGARRLSVDAFPEGVAILSELAYSAGLPHVPALYYVPSQMPNAFSIGSPKDSVVCVSDGLLRLFDHRELTGVLAHEVSHIVNRDLWIMGLADAMSRAVSLASWVGQFLLILNLPLLLSGAAYIPWHIPLLLIFSPTVMALLQLALSRTREFAADRRAAELTGDPEGLASALTKLERKTGRMWEDMLLPGRKIPEPSLLRTHPPTEERVKLLRELSKSHQPPQPRGPLRVPDMPMPGQPRFGRFGVYR